MKAINWWEVDWSQRDVDLAKKYGMTRQAINQHRQRCYSPVLSIAKRSIEEHRQNIIKLKKLSGLTWKDLAAVLDINFARLYDASRQRAILTEEQQKKVEYMLGAYEK